MKLHDAIDLVMMSPTKVALYHPDKKRLYMHELHRSELFDGTCIEEYDVFRPLLRIDGRFVVCELCVKTFGVDNVFFDDWAVVLCDLRGVEEKYDTSDIITMCVTEEDLKALGRMLTYHSPEAVFRHHVAKVRERLSLVKAKE